MTPPPLPSGAAAPARARSVLPTIAALGVVALTVSLGNWQMRRADEKAVLQAAREAALAADPVRIGAAPIDAAALEGRRVSLEGRFEPAGTVFLDNRTRGGVAGFHVLTPLRLTADGTDSARAGHVLVLRGWIARDVADRTRLPALRTPEGTVRIEGLAMTSLPQPIVLARDEADPAPDARIWQRLEPDVYRRWSRLALQPVLVRQTSPLDDGLARDWTEPGSGVDKHHGYAFQWYALALATTALWVWLVVIAPRRAAQREAAPPDRKSV
jgi:surfeit locus 1 family protein